MTLLLILLKILLWLLLILLALIFLILIAPIGYQAHGRYAGEIKKGEGKLSLLWGLIRLQLVTDDFRRLQTTLTVAGISKKISMAASGKETPKEKTAKRSKEDRPAISREFRERKEAARKKPREKPSISFSQVLEQLRNAISRELLVVIRRFLRKIWNALRTQVFLIKVVYGLPDPYETAMINNLMMTLFAVWPHRSLQLQPVFHDSLVDISGNIKGSLVPMAFLAAALQLILSKPVRRIWWPLLKKHLKKSSSSTSEAANA